MADTGIQWSSTEGNMRVGIKFVYDSVYSGTTSSTVRCEIYVRAVNFGFDDNQTVNWSGEKSGSNDYSFYSPFGGNTEKQVADIYIGEIGTSYGGGPSFTITATLSGVTTGGTPSKTYTFTLPARPASKPSAPTSTWYDLTSTSVTVSCTQPFSNGSTITDYDIQVDNNSDFSSPVVSNASRNQVVGGLQPGTKYYIRSRAQNGVGESTWSTVDSFTTLAAVPDAPNTPTVSDITNNSVRVNYTPPDNNGSSIVDYDVQIAEDAAFTVNPVLESGGTSPHDFTGLTPDTDYWVRVRAVNGVGNGPFSSARSFKTGATAPDAPTGLGFTGKSFTSIDFAWTEPAYDGGSAVTHYQVQTATNAAFNQNAKITDTTSPVEALSVLGLYSGMGYFARVRAVSPAGASAWSTVLEVSTDQGIPTVVTPSNGAVAIALGRLSVVYEAIGLYGSSRIEVEVSKGAETYVRELNLSAASVDNRYTITDNTLYLGVGTWNLRARVYNEQQATYTDWSPTTTMLQAHTPTAQVVSPIGGAVFEYQENMPFVLNFVDPAGAYDSVSAYRVVVETVSTGVTVFDSAKTAIAGTGGTQQIEVLGAIDPGYKDIELRWRAKVWDDGDTESAWSGYSLFTLATEPDVTITAPVDAGVVLNGAPTINWSSVFSLSATQKSAHISIVEDSSGEEVYTSDIEGGIFTDKPPTVVLTNLTTYDLTVRVVDTNDVEGEATVTFSTEYEVPDTIPYEIDTSQVNLAGYTLVSWRDAQADAQFVNWKVYRRQDGVAGWKLLKTIENVSIREYSDYMVVAGQGYLYSVTQTAIRSGEEVESPVGYRFDGASVVTENRVEVPSIDTYWIIDPIDNSKSTAIPSVDSDDSVLEFEDATYNIIGRGRHRDYGDELGYTGSLNSKVRIPERPSTVRLKVEELRRMKRTYYLRTPHGRLFPVALGNIGWSPLSGVGTFDMGNMTIPYEEVH